MRKYYLSEKVRQFHYDADGNKHSVNLRQIVALRDFADVKSGDEGGWLDNEAALSHEGECWIYDPNSAVFAGAKIEGNARLTGECIISHGAIVSDNARLDSVQASHCARISDNVTVSHSQIRGYCHLADNARILPHSLIIAAQGLTADSDKILRIYQRAALRASFTRRKFTATRLSNTRLLSIGRKSSIARGWRVTTKTTSGSAITREFMATRGLSPGGKRTPSPPCATARRWRSTRWSKATAC